MATAFLYNDGSFVFSSGDIADSSKTLVASYTGWDTATYTGSSYVPWYSDGNYTSIVSVSFEGNVAPVSTAYWLYGCTNLTSFDGTNLDTSNVTSMRDMFSDCYALTSLDVSNFNTSNVTTMRNMFSGCLSLTYLDVSNFDTNKVNNMINMFSYCDNLISLDLSNWNTSNCTNMSHMFQEDIKLTSLDLSNFDTSNVTDMESMFFQCSNLTTIYVSELWSTASVTYSPNMFDSCTSLVGGNGTVYSYSIIDATRACIDTAEVAGYFTDYLDYEDSPNNKFVKIKDYTLRKIGKALRSNGDTNTYLPSEMDEAIRNLVKEANESWAGTLTFSGDYADDTHFTESGCSLAVDKQKGMAFITIQSGTSTSYENVYFLGNILPDGVTALETQKYGGSTNGTAQSYFTQALTGITGKINVNVEFSARSSSYDYVRAIITVTYV